MKRIAENRELDRMIVNQFKQFPKIRMQDRITARNIKIGRSSIYFAEIKAVVEGAFQLLPCHGKNTGMVAGGVNITVLAPLVTCICYVPLKGKVWFHDLSPSSVLSATSVQLFSFKKNPPTLIKLEDSRSAQTRKEVIPLLFVACAAGRPASRRLLLWLIAATAGCRGLCRLVISTAGSRFLIGLVTCTAGCSAAAGSLVFHPSGKG